MSETPLTLTHAIQSRSLYYETRLTLTFLWCSWNLHNSQNVYVSRAMIADTPMKSLARLLTMLLKATVARIPLPRPIWAVSMPWCALAMAFSRRARTICWKARSLHFVHVETHAAKESATAFEIFVGLE